MSVLIIWSYYLDTVSLRTKNLRIMIFTYCVHFKHCPFYFNAYNKSYWYLVDNLFIIILV